MCVFVCMCATHKSIPQLPILGSSYSSFWRCVVVLLYNVSPKKHISSQRSLLNHRFALLQCCAIFVQKSPFPNVLPTVQFNHNQGVQPARARKQAGTYCGKVLALQGVPEHVQVLTHLLRNAFMPTWQLTLLRGQDYPR